MDRRRHTLHDGAPYLEVQQNRVFPELWLLKYCYGVADSASII